MLNQNVLLLKINKFIYEKKYIEEILNIYINKILFPKEFIQDIKKINGLTKLYYYIEGYNSSIKEARYLSVKLKNISSWGYIFNSYNSWNNSINIISIEIKKYQILILNYIDEKQKIIENNLANNFKYSNWLDGLIIFLYLRKNQYDENNFICKRLFGKINLVNNLTLKQVKILLPLFSNSKLIQLYHSYYIIIDL